MAVYCISDIHGERRAFDAMMEKINFGLNDTLYVIGDIIDRGPEGITLLRTLMKQSNVEILLGNHELMMLNYLAPGQCPEQARIWEYNGCQPTLAEFRSLSPWEQERILNFLARCPDSLDLTVGGNRFFLVHGFPGADTHEAVWGRPMDTEVDPPLPGRRVIIGHTPVPLLLTHTDTELRHYLQNLERTGGHVEILHARGFIDLDCGCGHSFPGRALSCLRLDDMEEFYVPLPLR